MSKKFLVAVDGSEHAWKALDLATDLARACDAALLILHVVRYEPLPEGLKEYARMEGIAEEEERARYRFGRVTGDRITSDAKARAEERGVRQVTTRGAEGNAAEEIVAAAEAEGADMIFVGSRGLSDAKSLFMGSVSHKVMHLAPCSCVAVK